MFDNDMNITNRSNLFNSYSKVYIISSGINNYRVDFSEKVTQYKENLIQNVHKLIPNSVILNPIDLKTFLVVHKCIDVIYPGVGHNQDLINKFADENRIIINYIYREEDLTYWRYANSGFYKFKTAFYKLNDIKI